MKNFLNGTRALGNMSTQVGEKSLNLCKRILFPLALLVVFTAGTSENISVITSHDFTRKTFKKQVFFNFFDFENLTHAYLQKGWSTEEQDSFGENKGDGYVWAVGKEATLRFTLLMPEKINATLKCAPLVVPGKEQVLTIAVNRKAISTLTLRKNVHEYEFVIPKEILVSGSNFIKFSFTYARKPKSLKMNNDERKLSARFYSLAFQGNQQPDSFADNFLKHPQGYAEGIKTRIEINNQVKIALAQTPHAALSFADCYIPNNSRLKFFAAIHPAVKRADSQVKFSVYFKEYNPHYNSDPQQIFSKEIDLNQERVWKKFNVDLSEYSGKIGEIIFHASSTRSPNDIVAVWGEPKIESKQSGPQHDTILVTMDALRRDRVGAYGYKNNTTPNIDSFAKDSVKFLNSYATSPWTLPSFASMYTSLYPPTHGAGFSRKRCGGKFCEDQIPRQLDRRIPNIHDFLSPFGYHTQLLSNNVFLTDFGIPRHFNVVDRDELNQHNPFFTDRIEEMLSPIERKKSFLHIHIMPPHDPYSMSAPYDKAVLNKWGEPQVRLSWSGDGIYTNKEYFDIIESSPHIREYISLLYDTSLQVSDEFFGRVMKAIKKIGLYEESLIIFSSDHGEELWDHGGLLHCQTLYQEQLQVPLLIKFPKSLKVNSKQVNREILNIDILPIILKTNNVKIPEYFHGTADFDQKSKRDYLYFFQQHNMANKHLQAVKYQNYKYIYSPTKETEELYDLASDPGELRNIVNAQKDLASKLKEVLSNSEGRFGKKSLSNEQDAKREQPNEGQEDQKQPLGIEAVEKLRDLGYL